MPFPASIELEPINVASEEAIIASVAKPGTTYGGIDFFNDFSTTGKPVSMLIKGPRKLIMI